MSLDIGEFPEAFQHHLTERELIQNSTLRSLDSIRPTLSTLEGQKHEIDSILHVGCKWGGFTAGLGKYLEAADVYGIDIDTEMRSTAKEHGITVFATDVETESIPLEDDSIDLVVAFGLLEHLIYYDNLLVEANRVLNGGWFWVTTPNLGGWLNRFALLTGHQPRNVEVSREGTPGVLPFYREEFLNHVHAPTYKTLVDLLGQYGFTPVETTALTPYQKSRFVAWLDRLFSVRTAWGRRVSVLARQV